MPYFVMAGVYKPHQPHEKPRFAIVSPSGAGSSPYVTALKDGGALLRLCQHHAHFYRLADDLKSVTLVRESGEANGVGCPKTHALSAEQEAAVRFVIETNRLYAVR